MASQRAFPQHSNTCLGRNELHLSGSSATSQYGAGHFKFAALSSSLATIWFEMQSVQTEWEQPPLLNMSAAALVAVQMVHMVFAIIEDGRRQENIDFIYGRELGREVFSL